MVGTLPPLQRVPNLRRLLAPGEALVYTAKIHPMFGWPFGLVALGFLLLSYWWPVALLGTVIFSILHLEPLRRNEIAVTSERLLLRVGHFRLLTEAFDGKQLQGWHLHQSILDNALHTGTMVVTARVGEESRDIILRWLWHPLTFVEALETLQPNLRESASRAS